MIEIPELNGVGAFPAVGLEPTVAVPTHQTPFGLVPSRMPFPKMGDAHSWENVPAEPETLRDVLHSLGENLSKEKTPVSLNLEQDDEPQAHCCRDSVGLGLSRTPHANMQTQTPTDTREVLPSALSIPNRSPSESLVAPATGTASAPLEKPLPQTPNFPVNPEQTVISEQTVNSEQTRGGAEVLPLGDGSSKQPTASLVAPATGTASAPTEKPLPQTPNFPVNPEQTVNSEQTRGGAVVLPLGDGSSKQPTASPVAPATGTVSESLEKPLPQTPNFPVNPEQTVISEQIKGGAVVLPLGDGSSKQPTASAVAPATGTVSESLEKPLPQTPNFPVNPEQTVNPEQPKGGSEVLPLGDGSSKQPTASAVAPATGTVSESLEKPLPQTPNFPVNPEQTVNSEQIKRGSGLVSVEGGALKHAIEDEKTRMHPAVSVEKKTARSETADGKTVPLSAVIPQPVVVESPVKLAPVAAPIPTPQVAQMVAAADAVTAAITVSGALATTGEGEIHIRLKEDVLEGSSIRLTVKGGELKVLVAPASRVAEEIFVKHQEAFQTHLAERVTSWRISVGVSLWGTRAFGNYRSEDEV